MTETGRSEFQAWIDGPTKSETPRNEFLLKLFFIKDPATMIRLFQEGLEKAEKTHKEFKKIKERLESLPNSPSKAIRLKALRYGMDHVAFEIKWLKGEIL